MNDQYETLCKYSLVWKLSEYEKMIVGTIVLKKLNPGYQKKWRLDGGVGPLLFWSSGTCFGIKAIKFKGFSAFPKTYRIWSPWHQNTISIMSEKKRRLETTPEKLQRSDSRKWNLAEEELLKVCDFLNVNPNRFGTRRRETALSNLLSCSMELVLWILWTPKSSQNWTNHCGKNGESLQVRTLCNTDIK